MLLTKAVAPARTTRVTGNPDRSRRRGGMARGRAGGERPLRATKRRRIKPAEVERLVRELRTWDYAYAPLTWQAAIDLAEGLFAHKWTRQAFESHAEIKAAFQTRQAEGPRKAKRTPRDPALAMYAKQIEALEEENRTLRGKLAAYEQKLARYIANALTVKGMTEAVLDAPLPPNDRGQTDPKLKGGVR